MADTFATTLTTLTTIPFHHLVIVDKLHHLLSIELDTFRVETTHYHIRLARHGFEWRRRLFSKIIDRGPAGLNGEEGMTVMGVRCALGKVVGGGH